MEAGAEVRMEPETETDFEQSIDEINTKKLECNGLQGRKRRSGNNPDYRDNSHSESEQEERNGYLLPAATKKKKSKAKSGGSGAPNHHGGGKPFSHQMRKSGGGSQAVVPRLVLKSGGKPRSMMLGMSGGGSKKKQDRARDKSYYHSQITEDKNTIKIRIRKASTELKKPKRRKSRPVASSYQEEVVVVKKQSSSGGHHKKRHRGGAAPVPALLLPTVVVTPTPIKPKETKKKSAQSKAARVVEEQTPWGAAMPQEVLVTIFSHVVAHHGVLPTLVKLGEVCRTWHSASVTPQLWGNVELSQHTKDKMKTDHRLVWLLENRLRMCQQLNLGNWKVSNLSWIVESLTSCCPLLEEINLSGWKGLSVEQLRDITHGLTKLARLDLSHTSEASSSGGCLSVVSLTQMSRGMGGRLTHLTLANNKLAGLPSILNSLAEHCPNLELLDLSNLWVVSHPAMVPLERLQKGCPRLRVLRITNSQVVLATATTQDQMESPGFPLLEELSVACPSVDYKLVDDEALGRILKGSTCLRLLDVRGCIRITDSGLIKVPAWDLQHLFLSGCAVTRQCRSCLELICEKWSHSLVEVDLAWATATQPLDAAVDALADRGAQSKLRILNLCGSSVSLEPVKRILVKCPSLESVNLASCRALPRGMKRHYTGQELQDLRDSFDPVKKKEKEDKEKLAKDNKRKAQEEAKKLKEEAKVKQDQGEGEGDVGASPSVNNNNSNSCASGSGSNKASDSEVTPSTEPSSCSPMNKQETLSSPQPSPDTGYSPATPKARQDTPKSTSSWNMGNYSPSVTRQESPYPSHSPSVHHQESPYSSQKSPSVASPYSSQIRSPSVARQESPYSSVKSPYSSVKSPSMVRQESPYSSQVSPSVVRQESPYSSHVVSPSVVRQESPYSSHMSPSVARQESPYSSHVSPSVVRQESPYSSHVSPSVVRQESPYSSQKSPDPPLPTKLNQTSGWNLDQYSPVMRQESASSSQPSPETAQGVTRPWNLERFSPMPSSAMMPSPDTSQVTSTAGKQWNLDRFSPMTRAESSPAAVPSPEMSVINKPTQSWHTGHPSPETGQSVLKSGWNIVNHFPPVVRPPPLNAHLDAHNKSNWNLNQFNPKVDGCVVMPGGGGQRTGGDGVYVSDHVTTTTYCANPDQNIYNNFRDPINAPSSMD